MIPGILGTQDLPDVYNTLAGKKLKITDPWDALFKPLTKSKINSLGKKYSIKDAIAGGCNADL